ncbi:hypothetical protein T439DRAFT_359181 [Meredithblackwellia eburnea MCA 4105]
MSSAQGSSTGQQTPATHSEGGHSSKVTSLQTSAIQQIITTFTLTLGEALPSLSNTWNIWFDTAPSSHHQQRWEALFDIFLSKSNPSSSSTNCTTTKLDIIALQEVIEQSFDQLMQRQELKDDWFVVDFRQILTITQNWYGTTLLIRKSWMKENGLDRIEAGVTRHKSCMAREFLAVELGNDEGVVLRIGTSHFESGTNDIDLRRRQFLTAARLFSFPSTYSIVEQPPPEEIVPQDVDGFTNFIASTSTSVDNNTSKIPISFIMGDTNISSYSELDTLTKPSSLGYVDLYNQFHPVPAENHYSTHETFYTTYPYPHPHQPDLKAKRIDYILAKGEVVVKEARVVGDQPVKANAEGREDIFLKDGTGRGKDGWVYPSDHLGVVVALELNADK